MTKAEHVTAAMEREGLFPEIDDDGDLCVRYEGGSYIVYADPDDEPYVRILFPNFWSIDSDDERARAYRAASRASRHSKGAKVWLREDEENVCASMEGFLPGPEFFEYVFPRMMTALQYAAGQFREQMRASAPDDATSDDGTDEGDDDSPFRPDADDAPSRDDDLL